MGILILAAAIAFVVEAVFAAIALRDARADGSVLAARLQAGDIAGAQSAASRLENDAHRAHLFTIGPLWWAGSHVPFLGADVSAVQDTASALNAIGSQGMPVLVRVAKEVKAGSLRLQNGRISTQAIASFAPALRQAADAIDPPAEQVARISPGGLIPPLNSLMAQVQRRVSQAKTAIDTAANAFQVLPSALGADGPRTYLLLVQNPAEIRASGGLPGTFAYLRAEGGKLSMTDAFPGARYTSDTPPVPPTAEESALFSSDWGTSAGSLTLSPDFPRVARMAAALSALHGRPVNGVFSADPVALSYVLRGTGPVAVAPGVVLTSGNVVRTLLSTIYLTLPNEEVQNAFYTMAAGKIFQSLMHGGGNQITAVQGLVDAVARHRVFAWSSEPALAKVLTGKLAGDFPKDTGKTPQVGVYLNSGIAGKTEYYLQQSSSVTAISCSHGVQTLRLVSTFRSTMPATAAQSFPPWVVGTGALAPRGDILDNVYLAGPWRGSVDAMTVDGKPVDVTANELDGRQMATYVLTLRPGQQVRLVATMHTAAGQTGAGELSWTPGMTTALNPTSFASACS